MADVNFKVVNFAVSTLAAANTFDVTYSGTVTPKAVMFFLQHSTSDDTVETDGAMSIGFTDGVTNVCSGVRMNGGHGTGSDYAGSFKQTDSFMADMSPASTGLRASVNFDSWINSGGNVGIRILINDDFATAKLATAVFFWGSDISNVHVGETPGINSATTTDITAPGFEPDIVFCSWYGANQAGTDQVSGTIGLLSFGAALNDGADTNRCMAIGATDKAEPTDIDIQVRNDACVTRGDNAMSASISGYDASGFDIVTVGTVSCRFMYMALKFSNSPDLDVFDVTVPTSGSIDITAPGFQPNGSFLAVAPGAATINTVNSTSGGGMSISALDASNMGTHGASIEDGVNTTTNANGYHSNSKFKVIDMDDSTLVDSSGYAFDSQGINVTLTNNPSTAFLGWGFAIGSGVAGTDHIIDVLPGGTPY